jgi:hypothetical protein
MRPRGAGDAASVRGWVRAARHIVVLSGAGMSAESGVPTFRDAQTGLWANFRPEELATEEAFRANPQTVWDWYAMRRESLARVQPNAGHGAIAAFQQRHPGRLTVVTGGPLAGPAARLLHGGRTAGRPAAALRHLRQPAPAGRRLVRGDAAAARTGRG